MRIEPTHETLTEYVKPSVDFSAKGKTPYLSSSGLKGLLSGSVGSQETHALAYGSLVHSYLELMIEQKEPEIVSSSQLPFSSVFGQRIYNGEIKDKNVLWIRGAKTSPQNKLAIADEEFSTGEREGTDFFAIEERYQELFDKISRQEVMPVTGTDEKMLRSMVERLRPVVESYLGSLYVECEESFYIPWKILQGKLNSMPDFLRPLVEVMKQLKRGMKVRYDVRGEGMLLDWKTFSGGTVDAVMSEMNRRQYWLQLAYYLMAAYALGFNIGNFVFVFCPKTMGNFKPIILRFSPNTPRNAFTLENKLKEMLNVDLDLALRVERMRKTEKCVTLEGDLLRKLMG